MKCAKISAEEGTSPNRKGDLGLVWALWGLGKSILSPGLGFL